MTFLACLSFSSETHTHNQICTLPLFLQTIVRRSYSQVFIKGVCYLLSHVQLFITSWTVAHQAPPCMGFSRQEYWSGLPYPSTGALPDPGIEPRSPALQADALTCEPPGILHDNMLIQIFATIFSTITLLYSYNV